MIVTAEDVVSRWQDLSPIRVYTISSDNSLVTESFKEIFNWVKKTSISKGNLLEEGFVRHGVIKSKIR
jgi:hypothetical protein